MQELMRIKWHSGRDRRFSPAGPMGWSHPQSFAGEGWKFGQLGNRQALNRAYQYFDLVPKGRDEEGFKFPMDWLRRHDQY